MVGRARLSAPREDRNEWPWHQAKWTALSASLLTGGDRRMEAENYLAGGYGLRLAMEARKDGWAHMERLAKVWQPNRLKGIQVGPEFGTPFLAATQVFDLRPAPRKWLSLDRTENAAERFVTNGTILVTCSGSVGRATLTHRPHENILISHDLLRVEPQRPGWWGWLYAFLRAPQTRAMMTAVRYGHMIKHLEVSHLNALPMPILRDELLTQFQDSAEKMLAMRRRAFDLSIEAERLYNECFPSLQYKNDVQVGYEISASEMLGGRRRLDGGFHVSSVKQIVAAFHRHAVEVVQLSSVVERVFVPGRFKHIYGDGGTPYLDSADILEVNPDIGKLVLSLTHEEQEEYRVTPGWILIPCSGQVYGIIGHAVLATEWHVGKVLSNHILRVCPRNSIRGGYLQCVLGHPKVGRPQLVRLAFGSSVPEIAGEDVATVAVPRLSPNIENHLADMMEESAKARGIADDLEKTLATDAENLIDRFLSGNRSNFVRELVT